MSGKTQFINLHTHRKPQLVDELVVRNAFLLPFEKLTQLPYSLSCGVHPWLISNNHFEQLNHLELLIHRAPNVIAVGECGLDRLKGPSIEIQLEVFRIQIQLANQYKKPLILHLVKTYSDFLAISSKIKVPFIIHGYKGNNHEANQLIAKKANLSFGPRLLTDLQLQETFKNVPLEMLYLETDTKPISIKTVYQKAAEIKNLSVDALRESISNNFARDFKS